MGVSSGLNGKERDNMALPRNFIDELHARNDIVEVLSSYLPMKRQGRIHKALCPFHNEKTASFTVYPDTQSFYCFGCNAGGDVITFVMKQENLDYVEAVKLLAQRAGMAMPEETDDGGQRLRRKILDANKKAARFFFDSLNTDAGREVRAYLRRRGLSDSTIKKFGIGYSPDTWGSLRDYLRKEGFYDQELIAAGLLVEGKKGSYDAFRGRVMFPIIDLRGNVIAFGGRTLGDGPKYLNTSDTEVFKKSRNLFALNVAKNTPDRTIILAEGYMDVIALHQAGFTNAVATLGTALTAEQARVIANYADEIVICYDSDEAGQRATRRAIDILREVGLLVKVLNFEGAKDPDEFIKKFGAERFRMLLTESSNSVEYELAKAKAKYPISTDEGRVQYLAEASAILARCQSPTERDVYAGRIAEEIKVGKQAILTQAEEISRRRWKKRERDFEKKLGDISSQYQVSPHQRNELGTAAAERRLLALLFQNPDMLQLVKPLLRGEDFFSEDVLQIYLALQSSIEEDAFSGFGSLTALITSDQMSILAGIVAMNTSINYTAADAEFLVKKMRSVKERLAGDDIRKLGTDEIQFMIEKKKKK